ncbi:MAG: hypothetical protein PHQ75_13175 [Thermoguttaceae bacterium]|nr:hypothetical protein [Thermoguttaceae bacterium]
MSELFDYTKAVSNVCVDMCAKLPVFSHIDMNRVCVTFGRSRSSGRFGVWAFVTPLRFQDGQTTTRRGQYLYAMPVILAPDKRPYLYVMTVVMPRFQNLALQEKYLTLIHELYHISPLFDGDIRRFEGRCYAHGASKKKYDQCVKQFGDEWMAKDPAPEVWEFLKYDFSELASAKGRIVGTRVRVPAPHRIKEN